MSMDASQGDLEEEEVISANGEGDEVMEEVEPEEGYSTSSSLKKRFFTPPRSLSSDGCVCIFSDAGIGLSP